MADYVIVRDGKQSLTFDATEISGEKRFRKDPGVSGTVDLPSLGDSWSRAYSNLRCVGLSEAVGASEHQDIEQWVARYSTDYNLPLLLDRRVAPLQAIGTPSVTYESIGGFSAAKMEFPATRVYGSLNEMQTYASAYLNCVNNTPVLGFAAGLVRCVSLQPMPVYYRNNVARYAAEWLLSVRQIERAPILAIEITNDSDRRWAHIKVSGGKIWIGLQALGSPNTTTLTGVTVSALAATVNGWTDISATAVGGGTENATRIADFDMRIQPTGKAGLRAYVGSVTWQYAWDGDGLYFVDKDTYAEVNLNGIF